MQSLNRAGEFHRGCYETRQPYIHFFLGDSQRPAPAGHATCGRGSHDLRPRVTRPAPAGRWLCAEEKRKDALKIRESPLKIRESPFKNQEDSTTKQAKGKSPKP